jgi:uncharacterized protein
MTSKRAMVVIVHGSYGSPSENWFPWMKQEVERSGHSAVVPSLPTPTGQSPASWDKAFSEQVGPLNPGMVLVGHSLGPAFILSLLERSQVAVRGTVLVSAFLGKLGLDAFDTVNEPFVCRDFDWDAIRRNAGTIRMYSSDNDPYVPLQRGLDIAARLGVQMQVVKGGGHINAEAGFLTFPQLLSDLLLLLD